MSNVEFNDEQRQQLASMAGNFQQGSQGQTTLVRWVMAVGVKTPEAANKVLLGIAIAALILMGLVIYRMNGGSGQKLTPKQLQEMKQRTQDMIQQPR